MILVPCGFGACTKTLDRAQVDAELRAAFEQRYSVTLASLDCPPRVEVKEGSRFACRLRTDGGVLGEAVVSQRDDAGKLDVGFKGLVDIRALEQEVRVVAARDGLADGPVTVTCGVPLREAKAGAHFACGAETDKGSKRRLEVTIKDTDGNWGWSLVDPAPIAPRPPADAAARMADEAKAMRSAGEEAAAKPPRSPTAPVDPAVAKAAIDAEQPVPGGPEPAGITDDFTKRVCAAASLAEARDLMARLDKQILEATKHNPYAFAVEGVGDRMRAARAKMAACMRGLE